MALPGAADRLKAADGDGDHAVAATADDGRRPAGGVASPSTGDVPPRPEPDPPSVGIDRRGAVAAMAEPAAVPLPRAVDVDAGRAVVAIADTLAVVLDRAVGVDHGRSVLT